MIDCGIVGEDAISVVQLLQADLKSKYVREVDAVIQVNTGVDPGKWWRQLLWKFVRIQVVFLWFLAHRALEFFENLQAYTCPKFEGDVVLWALNGYANGKKIFFKKFLWRVSIETLLFA